MEILFFGTFAVSHTLQEYAKDTKSEEFSDFEYIF